MDLVNKSRHHAIRITEGSSRLLTSLALSAAKQKKKRYKGHRPHHLILAVARLLAGALLFSLLFFSLQPSMSAAAAREVGAVEAELRHAKETLTTLNSIAAQAERGAIVDFDLAKGLMEEVADLVRPIAQGTTSSIAGTTVVSTSGPATLHARVGVIGQSQNVTPLQRRRAEQVLSEVKLIEATLGRYARKAQQQASYASQVKTLIGNGAEAQRQNYEAMDHLEREKKSLQYARQRMQAMESESKEVLQALQDQGRRLGGVGNKLGNLLETLGVSNTTILQIVRRNEADAWIVYGGIALLLFFLWYIW